MFAKRMGPLYCSNRIRLDHLISNRRFSKPPEYPPIKSNYCTDRLRCECSWTKVSPRLRYTSNWTERIISQSVALRTSPLQSDNGFIHASTHWLAWTSQVKLVNTQSPWSSQNLKHFQNVIYVWTMNRLYVYYWRKQENSYELWKYKEIRNISLLQVCLGKIGFPMVSPHVVSYKYQTSLILARGMSPAFRS